MEEQEALWITKALDGDDSAFGQLVEKYQRPVFSLCYRMLGNSKAAEDAAQESFIRAYNHLKRYDPNRSFATWLLSIASHYCIDQMRKRRLDTYLHRRPPRRDHRRPSRPQPGKRIPVSGKGSDDSKIIERTQTNRPRCHYPAVLASILRSRDC